MFLHFCLFPVSCWPLFHFFIFHLLPYPCACHIFHSVTSETDRKRSSGISSTFSAPSYPLRSLPVPDPSVPSFSLQTHAQPPSTTQQARPSPDAYSLPAFAHSHLPVLPKIFQHTVGSGTCQQMLLVLCASLSSLWPWEPIFKGIICIWFNASMHLLHQLQSWSTFC